MKSTSLIVMGLLLCIMSSQLVLGSELGLRIIDYDGDPSLAHGTSDSLSFGISNGNSYCDLSCEYELVDLHTQQTVRSGYFTNYAGDTDSITVMVTAPTKSSAPDIDGRVPYTLVVVCQEEDSFIPLCGSEPEPVQSSFTLRYHLSEQEQRAYDLLGNELDAIRTAMQSAEQKENYVRTKLADSTLRFVLLDDLRSEMSRLTAKYGTYERSYDGAVSLQDQREFIQAYNTLDTSLASKLRDLTSDIQDLDVAIEERRELHNEVGKKIDEVGYSLSKLAEEAQIVGLKNEFEQIKESRDSLSSDFNNGRFSSYDDLLSSVELISNKIDELSSQIIAFKNNIIEELTSAIKSEADRLCEIKGVCEKDEFTSLFTSNNIDSVCAVLGDKLPARFNEVNEQEHGQYLDDKDAVEIENSQIAELNSKINKLNDVIASSEKIINDEGLAVDVESCTNKVLEINEDAVPTSDAIDAAMRDCENLRTTVDVNKVESGFLSGIAQFFRKIVRKVNHYDLLKGDVLPLKELPVEPIPITFSEESTQLVNEICDKEIKKYTYEGTRTVGEAKGEYLTESSVSEKKEFAEQCCVFGQCSACCTGDSCKNKEELYPVIFLHGHSFDSSESPFYSLNTFNLYQLALISEKYVPGKTVLPTERISDYKEGDLDTGYPYTFTTTYYIGVYNKEGEVVGSISKLEDIGTYADQFARAVDVIKHRTNKDKVNIIVHSMGGLVAREYIRDHPGIVNKLIMLGTPNHGYPREGGEAACKSGPLFELSSGVYWTEGINECDEMHPDSSFLSTLNRDKSGGSTQYYTIAGQTEIGDCWKNFGIAGRDDCVIQVDSVALSGAENKVIRSTHGDLVQSEEALPIIIGFLKE